MTHCKSKKLELHPLNRLSVIAAFDGGAITSDAGALLLRETQKKNRLFDRMAACFIDYRRSERITHSVRDLIAQRVMAIAPGYEDVNDHNTLKDDPLIRIITDREPVDPPPSAVQLKHRTR